MTVFSPEFMIHRLARLAASVALVLAAGMTQAPALDSGWAETEGGRMRLVVDPAPREDGTLSGMLDVDLDPGWKTYWRDPGGSGIPPMLDFSQSRGVALEAMHYPAPVRVDDGYAIWAGYTEPVRFPLTFRREGTGDAIIRAQAFIGICEKICVPFQAELQIDLPQGSSADAEAKAMISEAFARLPEPAGEDFSIGEASLEADGKKLRIAVNLPAFRPAGATPELFIAGPSGFAFAPPRLTHDDGGQAQWSLVVEHAPDEAWSKPDETLDIVVTVGPRAMQHSIPLTTFRRD